MKRTKIKQSLRRSMAELPRPDFDYIAHAPIHRMEEHDYITRQEEPAGNRSHRARIAIPSVCLAACMLVLCLFGSQNWLTYQRIDLDVNPSFEITTNRKNEVLRIEGVNPEAQALLADDYRGQSLPDALNGLLAAMNSGGYLSSADNAVLVSVSAGEDANQTGSEISAAIQTALTDLGVSGSVYTQQVNRTDEIESQAQELGISPGKMQLIQAIATQLDGYSTEQLAGYTVTELIAIVEREGIKVDLQGSPMPVTGEENSTASAEPSADTFEDLNGKERLDEIIRGYQEIGKLYADNAGGQHDEEIQRRLRELEDALDQLGGDYAAMGRKYADYYRDKYQKIGESYEEKYQGIGESYAEKYKGIAESYAEKYRR
ncbi:MAG: hypothetical protein ACLU8W_01125 [Clostridia bacterium]